MKSVSKYEILGIKREHELVEMNDQVHFQVFLQIHNNLLTWTKFNSTDFLK